MLYKEFYDSIENPLERKGILDKVIDTYFEFTSLEEAKKCFEVIYGSEIASRIENNKIEHKINIYKYIMKE